MMAIDRATVHGHRVQLVTVIVNLGLPPILYPLIRGYVPTDLDALAVAGAIPTAWTVLSLLLRRRLDPVGVVAVCSFALAIVVAFATGGNPIFLKLHDAVPTGVAGLVLLVSAAVGRPLLGMSGRFAGSARAMAAAGRSITGATVIVGGTLIVHSAAHVLIAVSQPTGTYLVLSRVVGIPLLAAGGLLTWLWLSAARHRTPA